MVCGCGRFLNESKGLLAAKQLKETTMDPKSRILLRVKLPEAAAMVSQLHDDVEGDNPLEAQVTLADVDDLVERLMGKNAEPRFQFIQDNAEFASDIDV